MLVVTDVWLWHGNYDSRDQRLLPPLCPHSMICCNKTHQELLTLSRISKTCVFQEETECVDHEVCNVFNLSPSFTKCKVDVKPIFSKSTCVMTISLLFPHDVYDCSKSIVAYVFLHYASRLDYSTIEGPLNTNGKKIYFSCFNYLTSSHEILWASYVEP